MKKIILMVAAVMALMVPTATAQKVNADATLAKLSKSDAEVADAKKAAKSAVWVNRAKVYLDALMEPTKDLSTSFDATTLRLIMGENPTETTTDDRGREILTFSWVKVYLANGHVVAWEQTREIKEGLFEEFNKAAIKAVEMDPKTMAKVKPMFDTAVNYYEQLGVVSAEIPLTKLALDAFVRATEILENKTFFDAVDPEKYYYAGYLCAVLGAEEKQYFVDGEQYLNKSRELGYVDETGSLYYYLFHCYYGQREDNADNLTKAKDVLIEGIEKFPKNERILEGLIGLYTAENGVGDPAELVSKIDAIIAESPENPDLWFGRAQIFNALKNFDECIASFKKIDELRPNEFEPNWYLGLFYIEKGNEQTNIFNTKVDSFTGNDEYTTELKKVRNVYMQAVPYLEKALSLKPEDVDCAERLKSVCFMLRDEEGMMDKYNQYNAIYKKLKGLE